jgi:hypothetical protein
MTMRFRRFALIALLLLFPLTARSGGPAFIAGSGYDPGVEGQPLLWANATVQYYTDQGSLSPILSNSQADALVANAIAPWTATPGVGITVTQVGHLAEDVNGSNIQVTDGVITAPDDITPSATGTPLGIVYDYDGTVTDALLGQGAGSSEDCFTNAVYGGPDNFSASGNIAHALAVINGVCAATSAQLPDVKYRLVRVLGRIFGLGWSQANLNVVTNDPPPTTSEYLGFPVMHFADPVGCVPITTCYGGIFGGALGNYTITPAMDDATTFAALYPAANGNPQSTGGIWGGLYFTDASGNAAQMMQGVNVVARMMVNQQPSGQYVVSSVSGYPFVGNAGNIVTGYYDANGLPLNRFGSSDPSVEGFFNFGQLAVPAGQSSALYQISVEALDPVWSTGVGPYAPTQVEPSGTFSPVVVTVVAGSTTERDILMLSSEIAQTHPGSGSTYASPSTLPAAGAWGSWLAPYGSVDFFEFTAQANRTASVVVTALDELGNPTESKLQPVIGIWELSDETGEPAPAATPSPFNTLVFGMTRLDAEFSVSEPYRIGIADYRGDGRPDYAYQASVLYSDSVAPARLSVAGGLTALEGIGFRPGLQVSADTANGVVLTQSATEMQVTLPAATLDGTATIQVTDPVSGSSSQMIGALTYGAAATDLLRLLQGVEPTTPVGAQAPNLIRVRAVASDGVTAVNGATIAWSATNGVQFSACGGSTACSVLTDQAGEAATWVTPTAVGAATITAALAPLSYSPPQTQEVSLVATSSSLDLAALASTRWIAQDATLAVPLTVEALDMGAPQSNVTIKFTVTNGNAVLSSGTATTNGAGLATVTAQVTNLSATVQVSACVSPANSPCQTFTLFAVSPSSWKLEAVSGTSQAVPYGQSFQPLVMRVTDGSAADNPVMGANVTFVTTLERNPQGPGEGPGNPPQEDSKGRAQDSMPVILGTSQAQVVTDQNGQAAITPSVGSLGACDVFVSVSAGGANAQFELESVDPIVLEGQQPIKGPTVVTPVHGLGGGWARDLPDSSAETTLFAVPQAMPETDAETNNCSDAAQNSECGAGSGSGAGGVAKAGQPESAEPGRDVSVGKQRSPAGATAEAGGASSDGSGARQSAPAAAAQPDSSQTREQGPSAVADDNAGPDDTARAVLDDKRSCRFAQRE